MSIRQGVYELLIFIYFLLPDFYSTPVGGLEYTHVITKIQAANSGHLLELLVQASFASTIGTNA